MTAAARRARELRDLAERLRRLRPSHRDPEEFHFEKWEIERALLRMASRAQQEERTP